MENNAYNRQILQQVDEINKRYLSHLNATGKQVLDDDTVPLVKPKVDYEGSGIFSGLLSSIGLGKGEMEAGKRRRGRPRKEGGIIKTAGYGGKASKSITSGNVGGVKARAIGSGKAEMEGAGFFDSLASVAPLALLALGKPKKGGKRGRPRKLKGGDIGVQAMAEHRNLLTGGKRGRPRKVVEGAGFLDEALKLGKRILPHAQEAYESWRKGPLPRIDEDALQKIKDRQRREDEIRAYKRRGRKPKAVKSLESVESGLSRDELRRRRRGMGKSGAGFFDDIVSSVGNVVKTVADVAPSAISLAKMVRGKGKEAGAKSAGKKGGASPWIQHCKAYAKKHNMSYRDVLKDPKCRASYKK